MDQLDFIEDESNMLRMPSLGMVREAEARLKDGDITSCPCCDKVLKIYKRSIHSAMAIALIRAYKMVGVERPFHREILETDHRIGCNDFVKLAHWGLIREVPKDPKDTSKKNSGRWVITKKGEAFVHDNILVAKYCLIYNTQILGWDGNAVGIRECLGKNFNYNKLMFGG